ncbi:SgrR family transcriptional regulator [Enterovibrio norvegicus]|uniref:SgrR family transcriptional regulator n=1 Tax=Enterovibrio norvegicus TaxID=188144 RepID=UPI00352E53DF
MSGQRLQAQFSKIYAHFRGKDSDTNLQDMSEILFCTRRNARMVLNKMAEQGWLTWDPAVGRGKQSRLTFHRSQSDLQMKRVREWVKNGKLDAALEHLDNDAAKLAQLIQEQLGVTTQEGKQIIRLPYYRAFPSLNPSKPQRRSERHLITQIFNGLTRINERTNDVEPDLAHHWEALSDMHWRFYLRPAVKFHDGSLLSAADVIASLENLLDNAYFSHIETIESPTENAVDIYLRSPDCRLHETLAVPMAAIQSKSSMGTKNAERLPIGTGPYLVAENNSRQLVLRAHDQYFGFRALTDEIEIWVLDSAAMCYLQPTASLDPTVLDSRQGALHQNVLSNSENDRLALDEGCNYLLLNRRTGIAKDPRWAEYLHSRIASFSLMPYLAQDGIGEYRLTNAYGLIPGWVHTNAGSSELTAPAVTRLRLVHQADNPQFPKLAQALKAMLAADHVVLDIDVLSYEDMMQGKSAKKVDIWLCGMSLGNQRSDAILPWLMNFNHMSVAMPDEDYAKLEESMMTWRRTPNKAFPAETLGRMIVEQRQIIPLFHIWLGVVDGRDLEDVSSNNVGWFDFKSVWKKPSF